MTSHTTRAAVLLLVLTFVTRCFAQSPSDRPPDQPASAPDSTAAPIPEIRVQASRPASPAQIDPLETYDAQFINRTDAFSADELLSQLPEAFPGTPQLILIDGQETSVDPSTIPAARIARIEVSTTGVMPDGRPRFVGTVINIILKRNYTGANLQARRRDSFAGGGGQTDLNASGGYTWDHLSAFVNFMHRDQDPLLASQRDFSQSQDYTALGGDDYRTPYGTAPIVQAVAGSLNGLTDSNGAPVAIALAPLILPSHPLTPADFTPAPPGTTTAAGLKHFNTAGFLYLVAPATSDVVSGDLTYAFTPTTKLQAGYTFALSDSHPLGPPPITAGGLVPAADNPFGEDIDVSFVNAAFGPVHRDTSDDHRSGFLAGQGGFARTWKWNARLDLGHSTSTSDTRDLDQARFDAALAASDPAQRFNPFADMGPGSPNAALYPRLTDALRSDGTSDTTRLRLRADGQLSDGWIAPLTAHLGADRNTTDTRQDLDTGQTNTGMPNVGPTIGPTIGPTQAADIDTHTQLTSWRANASLDVPLFRVRELESPAVLTLSSYLTRDHQLSQQQAMGLTQPATVDLNTFSLSTLLNVPWTVPADAHPYAYQLDTRVGLGVAQAEGHSLLSEEAGALWSLSKPFTLRADYSRQQAPTPTALYPLSVEYDQSLIDRQRANALATNVQVISGQPVPPGPPLVSRLLLSAQWDPHLLSAKARVTLTYADVRQKDQLRTFTAQDILDNETALPGRVTRLPPTPEEIAAGEPGDIVQVDITPFTGGQRTDRSLALLARLSDTSPTFGTFNFRSSVSHVLSSVNQILPGTPIISTSDQQVPPAWTASAQADLQHGKWGAFSTFNYVSGGTYAGLPYASFGTLDARLVYQLNKPFGGWLGRTVRIGAGIRNLLNRNPPFANTLTGFHGGSPLGRVYELTVRAIVGD